MSVHFATFEVYQDRGGDWRWRLRAVNGRIVADSAEGYASRRNARRAVTATLDAVESFLIGQRGIREYG